MWWSRESQGRSSDPAGSRSCRASPRSPPRASLRGQTGSSPRSRPAGARPAAAAPGRRGRRPSREVAAGLQPAAVHAHDAADEVRMADREVEDDVAAPRLAGDDGPLEAQPLDDGREVVGHGGDVVGAVGLGRPAVPRRSTATTGWPAATSARRHAVPEARVRRQAVDQHERGGGDTGRRRPATRPRRARHRPRP